MQNIFIVPIEPIDTRYTRQWYEHIPVLLEDAIKLRNIADTNVTQIDGDTVPPKPTPGAFLDFAATNIYKSSQLIKIAELFRNGKVIPGDKFLFTDAWNTSILQVKYMSELLQIPVEIHALVHAGSYDPQDFLGRLIKDKRWTNNFEKSVWHAVDYNWYATDFHINMFAQNVFGCHDNASTEKMHGKKMYRTGWPMEYMSKTLEPYKGLEKRDLILFPHRMAPEKQPDLFRDLAKAMPQYEWIICQEQNLTKNEYHKLLGEAKIVFSANLQETLGISCFEGAVVDALSLVPDNLSYAEMYNEIWKYPSEWVESDNNYNNRGRISLIARIEEMMTNYGEYRNHVSDLSNTLQSVFFSADTLVRKLFDDKQ